MIGKRKKVTIIILTWNGLDFTKKCLSSLLDKTSYDNYEVVVVDNGSKDGTVDYLEKIQNIQIEKNDSNLGFVKGNNIAIERINEGDIILLNNDMIIIQSNWIECMQDAIYSKSSYGIAGCRLINEKNELLHAGTYIYPETCWGQQIGGGEKELNQYSNTERVTGVVFACVYIKREVIKAIGGLNERFFSYFEDTDYCLRAKEAGFDSICCGNVTLMHYQNVSTDVNKVDFSNMFLNSQKTFKKIWKKKLSEKYDFALAWNSIVNFPSGYAVSAKNMMLALDDINVDIRYKYVYGKGSPFPIEEPERGNNYQIDIIRKRKFDKKIPQIVYGQGDVFVRNTGRYKIGFTMLETTGVPLEWVRQANLMNEVWVPSSFNAETFKSSGVTVPIYTIPLGVNHNYYNMQIKSFKKHSKYTFLSIFEWGERKAPEILLKAYINAFDECDEVVLICKIINNDPDLNIKEELQKMKLPLHGPQIIFLYNYKFKDEQMPALYRSADCFVLPTRGEGWGMPILEAMACGLPVIATNWSAQTDFINQENSYPLDIEGLIDAEAKCPYYKGFLWAQPSIEHLQYLLRHVYSNREEAKQKGIKASHEVLSKWTWKKSAEKIKKRIIEIS